MVCICMFVSANFYLFPMKDRGDWPMQILTHDYLNVPTVSKIEVTAPDIFFSILFFFLSLPISVLLD